MGKGHTTLYVDTDLIDEGKARKINLSQLFENALRNELGVMSNIKFEEFKLTREIEILEEEKKYKSQRLEKINEIVKQQKEVNEKRKQEEEDRMKRKKEAIEKRIKMINALLDTKKDILSPLIENPEKLRDPAILSSILIAANKGRKTRHNTFCRSDLIQYVKSKGGDINDG